MAMEYLGCKVLDAALASLLQRMVDEMDLPFLKSVGRLFGVEKDAEKLSSALHRISSHLSDTERLWPSELMDVLYDAQHILEELAFVERRYKQETKIQSWPLLQVGNSLNQIASKLNLGPRIRDIREKLEETERRPGDRERNGSSEDRRKRRRTTSYYADESNFVGRAADKHKLVGLLLDNSSTRKDIEVVPICGMAGLGKTTLAQLVYHDEQVNGYFHRRVWVHVSKDFDVTRLTNEILESLTRRSHGLTNLDAIQSLVGEELDQVGKFLLVLDDVWNCDNWDQLLAPLMKGERGSRILITTRSRKVSSNMETIPTYYLRGLPDDDCLSLFKRQAFAEENSNAHPVLENLGKQIVEKCRGLPLSVKILGRLLRSKEDVEWEAVLKSEMWELQEAKAFILPVLKLSYEDLPAYLKRCFAYCCVFKKGSKVRGDQLVLMWMAQGFILAQGSKPLEDIGRGYLDDLVSRSLLDYDDEKLEYTMHDLTHDLSQQVLRAEFLNPGDGTSSRDVDKALHPYHPTGTESFKFDDFYWSKSLHILRLSGSTASSEKIFGSKQVEDIGRDNLDDLVISRSLLDYDEAHSNHTMHFLTHDLARSVLGAEFLDSRDGMSRGDVDKARHMSYHLCGTELLKFEGFYCLKSLLTLRLSGSTGCFEKIPNVFFQRLTHIRVLDLEGTSITMLPESIESLIHLQHLVLSRTPVGSLPKSITSLYYLQTLRLRSCHNLVELPSDLSNLINLRHLSLLGCSASTPARIGRLTSLQTLEVFKVGKEDECRIKELKNLMHLGALLCILNLENVVNVEEAQEAELEKKEKVQKLHLEWKSNDVTSRQDGNDRDVLEVLQPHTNLKELGIEGYCSSRFPTWLGNAAFVKLVCVNLFRCSCLLLPSFGQLPSLEHLSLGELHGLDKVGDEFKGFPKLKMLGFWSMPDLVEWSSQEGDISHVNKITISNCSKLRGLPLFPRTLESATIERCKSLTTLFRPSVSTIHDLTLSECDEKVLSSLQYLTSLSCLRIYKFPNLTSLPNVPLQPLKELQKLHIGFCGKLTSLSEETGLQHLTSLKSLEISYCPRLTSLDGKVLPTTLQFLLYLKLLESELFAHRAARSHSLVDLRLEDCPNIHSLPEELPTTLGKLEINRCPALTKKCVNGGSIGVRYHTSLK